MKLKSTMFFSSTALALAMAFGGAQAQDKAAERYKPNNELIQPIEAAKGQNAAEVELGPCKIFCVNVFLEVTGHTVTKYYTKLI